MKNLILFLVLVGSCVLLGGCPYETAVPIDTPSVKIDTRLLGTWVLRDNHDEIYTVSPLDEHTFQVVVTQKENDESDTYLAYASLVNKTTFLNITKQEPGETSNTFILYKLEFKDDRWITLTEVTDNIDEKFATSQELKKFISKNMMNSYFYGKEETNLVRPTE